MKLIMILLVFLSGSAFANQMYEDVKISIEVLKDSNVISTEEAKVLRTKALSLGLSEEFIALCYASLDSERATVSKRAYDVCNAITNQFSYRCVAAIVEGDSFGIKMDQIKVCRGVTTEISASCVEAEAPKWGSTTRPDIRKCIERG